MQTMRSKIKLLAMAVALTACTVENNSSIAIVANGLPNSDCILTDDPDLQASAGVLDLTLGHGYRMGPVVANRMRETTTTRAPTTGSEVETTTERNTVTIRGFEVELTCVEGTPGCDRIAEVVNVPPFFTPGAGTIPPGLTSAIPVVVIPGFIAREIKGDLGSDDPLVRVTLRAVGGRNADEELESGEFEYYVTLCEGCLVQGINPPQACPGGSAEGRCGLGQDARIDCCFVGASSFCPASSAPDAP